LSFAGPWTNTGTLRLSRGGTATSSNAVSIDQPGTVDLQPGTTLTIKDNLVGSTRTADAFRALATVSLAGTGTAAVPQRFEAMSNDLGNVPAGFHDNFAYAELAPANNTYVRLVDSSDNSTGTGAEAVYADTLVIPAGTTLDLNGFHCYARATQIAGSVVSGSVSLVPDGGPVPFGTPTPGAISSAGEGDDWTFFGRAG